MGSLIELIGIGIDVEDIARWEGVIMTIPPQQLDAMFSADEQRSCNSHADRASAYAGKWCAKEAIRKSISSLAPITLRHIVVLSEVSGAPRVTFEGTDAFEQVAVKLSITHSPTAAAAVAIAFRRE
jgi:phosphopantetheine--protein transferase-like protein